VYLVREGELQAAAHVLRLSERPGLERGVRHHAQRHVRESGRVRQLPEPAGGVRHLLQVLPVQPGHVLQRRGLGVLSLRVHLDLELQEHRGRRYASVLHRTRRLHLPREVLAARLVVLDPDRPVQLERQRRREQRNIDSFPRRLRVGSGHCVWCSVRTVGYQAALPARKWPRAWSIRAWYVALNVVAISIWKLIGSLCLQPFEKLGLCSVEPPQARSSR